MIKRKLYSKIKANLAQKKIIIVSGSGSLDLKGKIHESLAGRKRLFELTPITFEGFFHHKTNYKYEDNLSTFFEIEEDESLHLLFEYMNYGRYPRVVL